jgi:hypothetical protein
MHTFRQNNLPVFSDFDIRVAFDAVGVRERRQQQQDGDGDRSLHGAFPFRLLVVESPR